MELSIVHSCTDITWDYNCRYFSVLSIVLLTQINMCNNTLWQVYCKLKQKSLHTLHRSCDTLVKENSEKCGMVQNSGDVRLAHKHLYYITVNSNKQIMYMCWFFYVSSRLF